MKKKEIQVFNQDVTDYFEGDLETLTARLSAVLPMDTNPERMYIDIVYQYRDSSEIWVAGYRMETDEELAARKKIYEEEKRLKRQQEKQARVLAELREDERLRIEKENEYAQYLKLKAKYE